MKQVSILGCGAWGTAIAKLIGENVQGSDEFCTKVLLYARDGEDLAENSLAAIINHTHMNPTYLPGMHLPKNIVATRDLTTITHQTDIFVVAYPPRHIVWLMNQLKGSLKPTAYFLSFSKGFVLLSGQPRLRLISDVIHEMTELPCVVVIGATQAKDIADGHITEATVGSKDLLLGNETKRLVQSRYFRLTVVSDEVGVEMYGALKHVVALAAGMADGLQLGDNTKSAVLRLGFWEMTMLMKELFPKRGIQEKTLEQSCGMAELFMCMSHRKVEDLSVGEDADLVNVSIGRRISIIPDVSPIHVYSEFEALRGRFTDGVEYARVINEILTERNMTKKFPLFTAVHAICEGKLRPVDLIDQLRCHPVHS